MDGFNYTFPALRGVQAGREYFVAMCPLRLVPRMLSFDGQEVPPELRAQRVLNRGRIPAITRYIVENPHDYVFSAITASIDGEVEFTPYDEKGVQRNLGQLTVPVAARFVLNDGQHRRAAIEEALKENPDLGDESIAVVFFIDAGLRRSQQLFADLNTHAVRASASIGILYDFRTPLARVARQVASLVPAFKGRTEMERSTISNRSLKLFTLSGIYYASGALLRKTAHDEISSEEEQLALDFWSALSRTIPQWDTRVIEATASFELRRDFIHTHSVTLHALGMAGADLIATHPRDWQARLAPLAALDWRRANLTLWEGRAMLGRQMSKARTNIVRTASALKQALGLPLSPEEERLELLTPEQIAADAQLEEAEL
ncbi:MAG: DNA sulfur modification protein DndB [Chloroflexaceae bacterium]|nr:DNA sulfur modification protein DndB [Chloroflexaceae bacterium]